MMELVEQEIFSHRMVYLQMVYLQLRVKLCPAVCFASARSWLGVCSRWIESGSSEEVSDFPVHAPRTPTRSLLSFAILNKRLCFELVETVVITTLDDAGRYLSIPSAAAPNVNDRHAVTR